MTYRVLGVCLYISPVNFNVLQYNGVKLQKSKTGYIVDSTAFVNEPLTDDPPKIEASNLEGIQKGTSKIEGSKIGGAVVSSSNNIINICHRINAGCDNSIKAVRIAFVFIESVAYEMSMIFTPTD